MNVPLSAKNKIPLTPNVKNSQNDINKNKVCVIIPGYNVAETIGSVVDQIKRQGLTVVVVNDGSEDQTQDIALRSQAVVLSNQTNKGKGLSLRLGFEYALKNGYGVVITMDGDGQHSPADLANFLREINTGSDIVLGNRMSEPHKMPWLRLVTNKIMSRVISYLCSQDIPDSQNGFRLITSQCLKNLELKSSRFEIESEILVEAARKGYKIRSVPVLSVYGNSKSQIRPFRDTIKFIKFILCIW